MAITDLTIEKNIFRYLQNKIYTVGEISVHHVTILDIKLKENERMNKGAVDLKFATDDDNNHKNPYMQKTNRISSQVKLCVIK